MKTFKGFYTWAILLSLIGLMVFGIITSCNAGKNVYIPDPGEPVVIFRTPNVSPYGAVGVYKIEVDGHTVLVNTEGGLLELKDGK